MKHNKLQLLEGYRGRRVLVTGHTGFKGSWMTAWLSMLGAEVLGYSLEPNTEPSLFKSVDVEGLCQHVVGDVRNLDNLKSIISEFQPDYVFHLAAQALVRFSYDEPIDTIQTNVLGVANILEALRKTKKPCSVVIVTSDKCYENKEWQFGYRENDRMGGHDIYSMSKGVAELLLESYRKCFFHPKRLSEHGISVASARAGNVIGGGDWALDRIVPDAIRSLSLKQSVPVRNPHAVRPWQHVLEPLGGYLLLGAVLSKDGQGAYCEGWNFGPQMESSRTVQELVEGVVQHWGDGKWEDRSDHNSPHEAGMLRLSIEKAQTKLGWKPVWGFQAMLEKTVAWYKKYYSGLNVNEMRDASFEQIKEYSQKFCQGS